MWDEISFQGWVQIFFENVTTSTKIWFKERVQIFFGNVLFFLSNSESQWLAFLNQYECVADNFHVKVWSLFLFYSTLCYTTSHYTTSHQGFSKRDGLKGSNDTQLQRLWQDTIAQPPWKCFFSTNSMKTYQKFKIFCFGSIQSLQFLVQTKVI